MRENPAVYAWKVWINSASVHPSRDFFLGLRQQFSPLFIIAHFSLLILVYCHNIPDISSWPMAGWYGGMGDLWPSLDLEVRFYTSDVLFQSLILLVLMSYYTAPWHGFCVYHSDHVAGNSQSTSLFVTRQCSLTHIGSCENLTESTFKIC